MATYCCCSNDFGHTCCNVSAMTCSQDCPAWPDVNPSARQLHRLPTSTSAFGVGLDGQDTAPSSTGRPAGAPQGIKRKPAAAHHPLADIGGYKMPTTGRIGGAKGIGGSAGGVTKRKGQPSTAAAAKSSKSLSKEEADAIAAREAAKKRVQQRTLSTFGLG